MILLSACRREPLGYEKARDLRHTSLKSTTQETTHMEFELIFWKAAFFIYAGLHIFAKLRRFYVQLRKKRRSIKRKGFRWF
jgi:hypothetical protein